jgi:streptomycin 6-kinase
MIPLPAGVAAMALRGPRWAEWVVELPSTAERLATQWQVRPDAAGFDERRAPKAVQD